MKRSRAKVARRSARFTHRLVVLEDPAVVKRLQELADASGGSIAAETRYAIRRWIKVNEED